MSKIYDHLISCGLKNTAAESIFNSMEAQWESCKADNAKTALSGPSPVISDSQIAYLLAFNRRIAEQVLRPELQRNFRAAITEAKAYIVAHSRTHPIVDKIKNDALHCPAYPMDSERVPSMGEPDPFEDADDNNEDDEP